MAGERDDEVLRIALQHGPTGARSHRRRLIFGAVGCLILGLGTAWFMLVPNVASLLAGPTTVTVVGEADENQIEVTGTDPDGREVRDTIPRFSDETTLLAYPTRTDPPGFEAVRTVRIDLAVGLLLTTLFLLGTILSIRAERGSRVSEDRLRVDLDPAHRQERQMQVATAWMNSYLGIYSAVTLYEPDTGRAVLKSRLMGVRLPDELPRPATVYGRIEPGGNAVVDLPDLGLLVLHEPLVTTARSRFRRR